MFKPLILTTLAAAFLVAMASADQKTGKITIPVDKTAPTSGKLMFASYCAPCHGIDGKGNGPAAPALKAPASDLTVLSRNNHGKFPDTHIVSILQFGMEMPAHGSAQMPVWGPILGKMNLTNPQEKQLRISNLSRYLETLQVK